MLSQEGKRTFDIYSILIHKEKKLSVLSAFFSMSRIMLDIAFTDKNNFLWGKSTFEI